MLARSTRVRHVPGRRFGEPLGNQVFACADQKRARSASICADEPRAALCSIYVGNVVPVGCVLAEMDCESATVTRAVLVPLQVAGHPEQEGNSDRPMPSGWRGLRCILCSVAAYSKHPMHVMQRGSLQQHLTWQPPNSTQLQSTVCSTAVCGYKPVCALPTGYTPACAGTNRSARYQPATHRSARLQTGLWRQTGLRAGKAAANSPEKALSQEHVNVGKRNPRKGRPPLLSARGTQRRRLGAFAEGAGKPAHSCSVSGGFTVAGMRFRSSLCSSEYVSSIVPALTCTQLNLAEQLTTKGFDQRQATVLCPHSPAHSSLCFAHCASLCCFPAPSQCCCPAPTHRAGCAG